MLQYNVDVSRQQHAWVDRRISRFGARRERLASVIAPHARPQRLFPVHCLPPSADLHYVMSSIERVSAGVDLGFEGFGTRCARTVERTLYAQPLASFAEPGRLLDLLVQAHDFRPQLVRFALGEAPRARQEPNWVADHFAADPQLLAKLFTRLNQ